MDPGRLRDLYEVIRNLEHGWATGSLVLIHSIAPNDNTLNLMYTFYVAGSGLSYITCMISCHPHNKPEK